MWSKARWSSLGVWALAAASALAWGLKVFVMAPPLPPHARPAEAPTAAARGDLARLLGADAVPAVAAQAAPPADARFQLIGVVAPRSPAAAAEGVALIAVDGKPPKAYRVGAVVDGATVLRSVSLREASLGARDGGSPLALRIAPPAAATTGTLPPPGSAAGVPPSGNAVGVPPPRAVPAGAPPARRLQQPPENAPTEAPPAQNPTGNDR